MGQLGRVIAIGVLFGACAKEAPPVSEARPKAIPRAKAALDVPEPDTRFDAEGNLLPGPLKIGWLEIPIGFARLPGSTEHNGIFEVSGITLPQLRKYVTARGTPAAVEYMVHGEIYKQMAPTHTQLPLPPLDVTALVVDPDSKKLRLVVEDRASSEPTMTPQQAMDKLAKARDRTE